MMADTPEAINLFGLIVLKGDLKLLKHGIKRKGYNARTLARRLPGCPRTMDLDKLIEFVEATIEEKAKNPAAQFKAV